MRFHFSFIQHWKLWFVVSGLLAIIGIGGFFIRGLNSRSETTFQSASASMA